MTIDELIALHEPELDPCPFCGAKAEICRESDEKLFVGLMWTVTCTNHDCIVFVNNLYADTIKNAVSRWNERPK